MSKKQYRKINIVYTTFRSIKARDLSAAGLKVLTSDYFLKPGNQ